MMAIKNSNDTAIIAGDTESRWDQVRGWALVRMWYQRAKYMMIAISARTKAVKCAGMKNATLKPKL
jgi:hypothetical protein